MRDLMRLGVLSVLVAPPAAATELADIGRALQATRTLVATFRQTGPDGRTVEGTMTLKRPGRVRFDYGPRSSILVVADGRRLIFVDYRVRQVSQWPVRDTPLAVLLDSSAPLSRIARVLPPERSPVPGAIPVEAHDPKRPDLGRVLILFRPDSTAPAGLSLLGWRVIDAQNNLTVVELRDLRWNVEVADSVFRFADPRPRPARPGAPA